MKRLNRVYRLALMVGLLPGAALLTVARAAETTGASDSDPLGAMLLRTSLGLVVVLALIFALAWLARRWGGPTRSAGRVPMKVVGSLILAPRERIVVVAIEDTWLVIGVGPGGMRTLQELPARKLDDVPGGGGGGSSQHGFRSDDGFLARLQSAMQRRPS